MAAPLLLSVALIGQLLLAAAPASAVAATGCAYGTGGSQAASTCWLDFTGFSDATARTSVGQPFSISLPGGYQASFSVHLADVGATHVPFAAVTVPTYGGAYLGQNGHYAGLAGRPALYAAASTTGSELITVSNIAVQDSAGHAVSGFALLAADAESTNGNGAGTANREGLTFSSDVPLRRVDDQTVCGGGLSGVGTTTVSCIGDDSTAGNALFVQAIDPSTLSVQTSESQGGGLQGVAFAFVSGSVKVDLAVAGRVNPTDAFTTSVTNAAGTVLGSGATGTGSTATTGTTVVVPSSGGSAYTLGVAATSGSLANYSESWSCTNGAATSRTALPAGSGASKSVSMLAGDAVACTVTLAPLTRALTASVAKQVVNVDGDGLTDRGDRIDLAYTVTNSGQTTLDGVEVTDSGAGTVTCAASTLAPGTSTTCTATRTVTASDEIAGSVATSAVATGTSTGAPTTSSNTVTTTTAVTAAAPALTVALAADRTRYAAPGDVVTWTATVDDTGNTGLTALGVTAAHWDGAGSAPAFTCAPVTVGTGATAICTATHTVTQADVDAGAIDLDVTAAANRTGGGSGATASSQAVLVQGDRTAAVTVGLTPDRGSVAQRGDVIGWTFTARNTGTTTLHGLGIVVTTATSSTGAPTFTCAATTLAPGATTTCTASTAVTQADVDSSAVELAGVLRGTAPDGSTVVSASAATTVRTAPVAGVSLQVALVGAAPVRSGQRLAVRYTALNDGSASLQGVTISAGRGAGALRCPPSPGTLAPDETIVCESEIAVTDADVAAGAIVERAGVQGSPLAQPVTVVHDDASLAVPLKAVQRIAIDLVSPDAAYREGQRAAVAFVLRNTGTMGFATSSATARFGDRTVAVLCDDAEVAPGGSTRCHVDVLISAADVAAGTVPLSVSASGSSTTVRAATAVHTVGTTQQLAFTGAGTFLPIAGGTVAALAGLVLLLVGRRRRLQRR